MGTPQKTLAVWATGMIEFFDGATASSGAIRICTVTGDGTIKACPIRYLFDWVRDNAELYDFGGKVALKVPGIDPDRPEIGTPHDNAACDILIDWDEELFHEVGDDPAFNWERQHRRAA